MRPFAARIFVDWSARELARDEAVSSRISEQRHTKFFYSEPYLYLLVEAPIAPNSEYSEEIGPLRQCANPIPKDFDQEGH